jgi:hypothetical protein
MVPKLLRFRVPRLEHLQEKWNPVFRPKMRPRKENRSLATPRVTCFYRGPEIAYLMLFWPWRQ